MAVPALIPLPTDNGNNYTCLYTDLSPTTTNPGCDTTVTFAVNIGLLQITVPTAANIGSGDTGGTIASTPGTPLLTSAPSR